ncbi:transcription factor bHLH143-like [Henckelia pumila]|uniref:transcription factor bHLH143-like n=1 Tax=Henckelia pumila TaxID=405737 RepID=UPI003C6E37E0
MERDSGSWFDHRHAHLLSSNLNLSGFPYDIGWLNAGSVSKSARFIEDFHQTLAPVLNSASKEKLITGTVDFKQKESPILDPAPTEKRFLVFDQSGGKTTLIYSSGLRPSVQCGTCSMPKPHITYNDNNIMKGDPRIRLHPLRSIINEEHEHNNSRDDMVDESDMREDSEELDALLYSDSDSDFSEEDEETSTGHSPSTMTDNGTQDFVEETGEEVDNFAGPNKRQKLLDEFYGATLQKKTRSSVKTNGFSGLEVDAESTCRNGNWPCKEVLTSLSGTKRKERIQETLSVMQNIFPSLNGKGAIDAIDEAIHYLRSLKMKAKALGLDSI